jgi:hypothetical protein
VGRRAWWAHFSSLPTAWMPRGGALDVEISTARGSGVGSGDEECKLGEGRQVLCTLLAHDTHFLVQIFCRGSHRTDLDKMHNIIITEESRAIDRDCVFDFQSLELFFTCII